MKRIVICCDGTWNAPGDTESGVPIKTNVQKIFESVCNIDENGILQIKHYIEGVGTSGSKLRNILDGATGRGIDDNILNAYKFLVWNYVKGDEIYLFGFSRGAYTARSLAGLVRSCGIIRNDDLNLINEAYSHYRNRDDKDWKPNGEKSIDFRNKYSTEASVKFIGVWDTVGSLGIPLSLFSLLNSKKYHFHDTTLSSYVDYAYHALAIDEKRKSFKPTLWLQSKNAINRKVPQVLEQRWFTGVHSNIGGGYPDSGLSDVSLNWIVQKALGVGLGLDKAYTETHVNPDLNGKLYNSSVFPFNLVKASKRIISKFGAYNATLEPAVVKRWNLDESYKPSNLEHIMNNPAKLKAFGITGDGV